MSGSRRVKTRKQSCTAEQATRRLQDARGFLDLAEVAGDDAGVSAANAVLAGIAAAGAACCQALGERSRGEDHRDAITLVAQVRPGGQQAANALGRLLALKNDAEYGLKTLSHSNREIALRQARKLCSSPSTCSASERPPPALRHPVLVS
jgi:hypothetical protein